MVALVVDATYCICGEAEMVAVSIGCQSENDAYESKYDSERRERETLGEHHPYEVTSVIFWEIPKWLRRFIK